MSQEHDYTVGRGNVFADLGHPEPEIALAKADIAVRIAAIVAERGWNQGQTAEVLGLDQPQVSRLVRGQLRDFSLERLMTLLTRLDQDVRIVSRPNPEPARPARLDYAGIGWSGDGDAVAASSTSRDAASFE